MTSDTLHLLGATLGDKYRVVSLVSEGDLAVVYKATHLPSKRPVAVKVLKVVGDVPAEHRREVLEELIRHGAILAELSERSTAVVQTHDVGMLMTEKGEHVPYLVLAWLEGVTLEAVLLDEKRRGAPARSLEEAIRLLEPAADALAHAHARGLAHGHVKPANVFVLGDPRSRSVTVKVLDLGLATMVQNAQKIIGPISKADRGPAWLTPAYGAPEQLTRTHGSTGPWTDVFSFALVLVEVLTQRPPLDGDVALASSNPARRPTPRARGARVSDAVEAVFARALAVRADERYPTCGALWSALRAASTLAPAWRMPTGPSAADPAAPARRAIASRQRREEVLVPLALPPSGIVEPATLIRSTLVAASLLTLRSRGHFERYLANLPSVFHDQVLHSVAGSWLPMEVGLAHYRAADAMGLSSDERQEMGKGVAARIQDSLLGTLVRVAKTAGVTPWMGLEYAPKLWKRVLNSGGFAVYRLGPKEARAEGYGIPELAAIDYFRDGFRGMFVGSGLLFCEKIYVTDLPQFAARGIIGFRVAWV